jgi:hypothetical protein
MSTVNINSTDRKKTPWSKTLENAKDFPKTVCVDCQNAVWHSVGTRDPYDVQAYCTLMHSIMKNLSNCDGQTPYEVI